MKKLPAGNKDLNFSFMQFAKETQKGADHTTKWEFHFDDAIKYLNPLDLRTVALRPTCHHRKKTVHPLGFRIWHQMQIGLKIWIATSSVYRGGLCKVALHFFSAMISTCKVTSNMVFLIPEHVHRSVETFT